METESKPAETETEILTRILLEESETFELFHKPSNFRVIKLDANEESSTALEEPQKPVTPIFKSVGAEVFKKDKSVQTLRSQSIMAVKNKFTNTPS